MNIKLCEHCNKHPATVHYRENKNGVKSEKWLCAACAAQLGITFKKEPFGEDFLASFPLFATAKPREEGAVCPVCKTPLSLIRSKGVFGCAACYDTFAAGLDMTPFVGRGYAAGRLAPDALKTEKAPEKPKEKTDTVAALREQLRAALAVENYEEAAILRDRIREEEGK